MADGYSWSESRNGGSYRLPGPERLGWWAAAAMLVSILLHVLVFLSLEKMKIALRFEQAEEQSTDPISVNQVEVQPAEPESRPPPEEVVQPPKDASNLLEDVELLAILPKNQEIDIKTDVDEAEFALQMQNPAREGDPTAVAEEIASGMELEADLPELGREPAQLQPAEVGQVTVDPGAVQVDDQEISKFTEDLVRKGAGGNAEQGAMDGISSLDQLLNLPSNVLIGKKTMLPSDLLFAFNQSELRESAKIGLMKLALLMDRNPNLFCWIEGHTDLVGGDDFNLNLSIKRAEAVKTYLVNSLKMDASKIITRGFGRFQPIVTSGKPDEQAANRRVEIRMRKAPPTAEQMQITPRKPIIIPETPVTDQPTGAESAEPPPVPKIVNEPTLAAEPTPEPAVPPRAVLVKPKRALPVSDLSPNEETPQSTPPKANPVRLRAAPVTESPVPPDVPRALPVNPPPLAQPVDPALLDE